MFNPQPIKSGNAAQPRALIPQSPDDHPRMSSNPPDPRETIEEQAGVSSGAERMNRKRLHFEMASHAEPRPWQPETAKRQERTLADSLPLRSADPQHCARTIQRAFRDYRERNADTLKLKAYLHAVMEKVNTAINYSASAIEKNREACDMVPFNYRIQQTAEGARLVPATEAEKKQARFGSIDVFHFREYVKKTIEPDSNVSWPLQKSAVLARHGYGNCMELALYVQSIIRRDLALPHPPVTGPDGRALHRPVICTLHEGDHVFAVVGDPKDDHALVVDPWPKYINTTAHGKHFDVPVRHTEKTRGFLGPMKQFRDFLRADPELFGLEEESEKENPTIRIIVPHDNAKAKPAQYEAIANAIEARVQAGDKELLHQQDRQIFEDYIYKSVYRLS